MPPRVPSHPYFLRVGAATSPSVRDHHIAIRAKRAFAAAPRGVCGYQARGETARARYGVKRGHRRWRYVQRPLALARGVLCRAAYAHPMASQLLRRACGEGLFVLPAGLGVAAMMLSPYRTTSRPPSLSSSFLHPSLCLARSSCAFILISKVAYIHLRDPMLHPHYFSRVLLDVQDAWALAAAMRSDGKLESKMEKHYDELTQTQDSDDEADVATNLHQTSALTPARREFRSSLDLREVPNHNQKHKPKAEARANQREVHAT
ncbi:hypothetical protein C8J57DRAFT_1509896 [Mycena rebaudengoi]|nr:hypothetical protein C8J57DRAFT_1509896 [Mycena rebaudengoi]